MGEPSWTLVEEPSRVQEQSPQLRQQTPAVEESGLEKLHAWTMKPKNIAKCIWLPYWLAGKGVQKAHSILTGQDSNQNEPASAPRRVDPRVELSSKPKLDLDALQMRREIDNSPSDGDEKMEEW